MTARYFQWEWKKPRGDEYDSWGASTYFFETSPGGEVLRELRVFEHGKVLKHRPDHREDIYGQMAHALHAIDKFSHLEIPAHIFENAWDNSIATNH
jgi:hypothetical protein